MAQLPFLRTVLPILRRPCPALACHGPFFSCPGPFFSFHGLLSSRFSQAHAGLFRSLYGSFPLRFFPLAFLFCSAAFPLCPRPLLSHSFPFLLDIVPSLLLSHSILIYHSPFLFGLARVLLFPYTLLSHPFAFYSGLFPLCSDLNHFSPFLPLSFSTLYHSPPAVLLFSLFLLPCPSFFLPSHLSSPP